MAQNEVFKQGGALDVCTVEKTSQQNMFRGHGLTSLTTETTVAWSVEFCWSRAWLCVMMSCFNDFRDTSQEPLEESLTWKINED